MSDWQCRKHLQPQILRWDWKDFQSRAKLRMFVKVGKGPDGSNGGPWNWPLFCMEPPFPGIAFAAYFPPSSAASAHEPEICNDKLSFRQVHSISSRWKCWISIRKLQTPPFDQRYVAAHACLTFLKSRKIVCSSVTVFDIFLHVQTGTL